MLSIPRAQAIILKQLQRKVSTPIPWYELHGSKQLRRLRGAPGAEWPSSSNHALFPAASQALAGNLDARDFWNLLARQPFMLHEFGVNTVYSCWHWALWIIAREGFRRWGWDTTHIDLQLRRFAIVSALSAELTDGKYNGGELSHLSGAFCKGWALCLPWGKRGFSRGGANRTGPASHVFLNTQGWMLSKAVGEPGLMNRRPWEVKCIETIGPSWSGLDAPVKAEIISYLTGVAGPRKIVAELGNIQVVGIGAVLERTTEGLSCYVLGKAGVGRQGTNLTMAAAYTRGFRHMSVLTAGDGKRTGHPKAWIEADAHQLRCLGGSPTAASLPGGGKRSIPKPGGAVISQIEFVPGHGVRVDGAKPPSAAPPRPAPPRPAPLPPKTPPTSTTSTWQADVLAALDRAKREARPETWEAMKPLAKRMKALAK